MKKLLFVLFFVLVSASTAQAQTPRTIDIPRLGYQYPIPIVKIPLENQQWDVSGLGDYVGWLDQTGWMSGNTVLVAHNYSVPFSHLNTLQIGDSIIVYDGTTSHTFTVQKVFEVNPSEVWVTAPTFQTTLTLITCAGWNDTKRLVIVATE